MRGSLLADSGRFGFAGIIPAHAGLTKRAAGGRHCSRIIPAHAGLTNEEAAKYAADGDHPRACGAHWL